ncbi:hypothetical protein ACFQQB_09510 [Nonomuraea rubra]|uniref:hypothetical protein n=1 Tax=Nonomuraea rubra TaxID=46180 RepID=UPI00360F967E
MTAAVRAARAYHRALAGRCTPAPPTACAPPSRTSTPGSGWAARASPERRPHHLSQPL